MAGLGGLVGDRTGAGASSRPGAEVETVPGEGYRPHLDGLRAVAVYLVVAFHAGAGAFAGGFIGVDVFFVLSGYLVTQLLMRDLSARGTVRLGRFYARRMRRLLPASAVLLLVTAVVYSALASPAEVVQAVGAFKAAFLYVANWYFIRQSSNYFGSDINTNPVIHFWSLAIEEQFYLVWPLLLGGLFAFSRRWGRHACRVMQLVVIGAGLASLLWALSLAGSDVNRAYYGTDARAYQLLAGALLALSPGLVRRAARVSWIWVVAAIGLAGLLVVASSRVHLSVINRGVVAAVVTSVLIVAIEAARRGPVNGVLSSRPMVYLGKISYGTYLWHWPVIVVALDLTESISPLSLFAIAALVATGLASLSYTLLERPIREQRLLDRVNPVVIVTGLAISVICALVVIPYVLDPDRANAQTAAQNIGLDGTSGVAGHPVRIADLDLAHAEKDFGPDLEGVPWLPDWNCHGKPASACTIIKGGRPSILVIGDSHAWMWFPAFAKLAQQQHLTLSTSAAPTCPWQLDLSSAPLLNSEKCVAMRNDLYQRVIPELKPDLIVVGSFDYVQFRPLYTKTPPQEFEQQARVATARSLRRLTAGGAKVLLIDPIPLIGYDKVPVTCLPKTGSIDACRGIANEGPTPLEGIYKSLADSRQVFAADFDHLVCPFLPICDPIVNRQVVRFDYQHITPKFAESLAEPVTKFLKDDRLIPSG